MYRIEKRFSFSASHTIGGLADDHPCARLHGHNYEVAVVLESDALDARFDHRHLNDVLGHDRTTAEEIAAFLYAWCKQRWPEVAAVRVSETPRTWAEYRP